MFKVVGLLSRKEGLSHEEFLKRWDEHVPVARELPNVRKYTRSVPIDPSASPYDGIAEMYFDSPEACREAFESPAGRRQFEDAARFLAMPDSDDPESTSRQLLLDTMVEVRTEIDDG